MARNAPPKIKMFAGPQTNRIAIRMPVAGTAVLLSAGNVRVEVDRLRPLEVDEIWAIVHPAGTTPTVPETKDELEDEGYTPLPFISVQRFGADVECTVAPDGTASLTNNAAVSAVAVKGTEVIEDLATVEFKLSDTEITVDVPATACPWFAYADEEVPGPWGEVVKDHRPVKVRVPVNARFITVTATGLWRWAASNEAESGPNGKTGNGGRRNDAYEDVLYNSELIHQPAAEDWNSLLGLWRVSGSLNSQNLFKVGSSFPRTEIGARTFRALYLGHHDGFEWNTNHDQVTATIIWET